MSYGIASCIYLNQVFWAETSPLGFWMFRLSGHTRNYSLASLPLLKMHFFKFSIFPIFPVLGLQPAVPA